MDVFLSDFSFSFNTFNVGYSGVQNQGATCYMNSLLQHYFHIPYFRQVVYDMPINISSDLKINIPYQLQKVFYILQTNKNAVSTKALTKAFGWNDYQSFMQHDVQEFNRVLVDNLEEKMKGTKQEGVISKIFAGEYEAYIKCINVDFSSTRSESFYDLSLQVKGYKSLNDSLQQYLAEETLKGDNQYRAGKFGLQDAIKGIRIRRFPPVLQLHLKRFEFDPITQINTKINDYFSFPQILNIQQFIHEEKSTTSSNDKNYQYCLHSVFVHSGGIYGGHYYVYIKLENDIWYKFDDEMVRRVNSEEAINNNFGMNNFFGTPQVDSYLNQKPVTPSYGRSANAYMLVYVQESIYSIIMQKLNIETIPISLQTQLTLDIQEENRLLNEEREKYKYCQINISTSNYLCSLVDKEEFRSSKSKDPFCCQSVNVLKDISLHDSIPRICNELQLSSEDFDIYVIKQRLNMNSRPSVPLLHISPEFSSMSIQSFKYQLSNPFDTPSFFFRNRKSDIDHFDNNILIFFKYFDIEKQKIKLIGDFLASPSDILDNYSDCLISKMDIDKDKSLVYYIENDAKSSDIKLISSSFPDTLSKQFIHSGEIIIFHQKYSKEELMSLSSFFIKSNPPSIQEDNNNGKKIIYKTTEFCNNPIEYFNSILGKISIEFIPTHSCYGGSFPKIMAELHKSLRYNEVCDKISSYINVPAEYIRMKKMETFSNHPASQYLNETYFSLKDLMYHSVYNRHSSPSNNTSSVYTLFYEVGEYTREQLDNNLVVKIIFVEQDFKEKKISILIPRQTPEISLLAHGLIEKNIISEYQKVHFYKVVESKFIMEYHLTSSLYCIYDSNLDVYCSVYQDDELELTNNQYCVWINKCFEKTITNCFGIPFIMVFQKNEQVQNYLIKIQKRLQYSEEKIKNCQLFTTSHNVHSYFNCTNIKILEESDYPYDILNRSNTFSHPHILYLSHPTLADSHHSHSSNSNPHHQFNSNRWDQSVKLYH